MVRKDTSLRLVPKIYYCCIFSVNDLDAYL